MSIWKISVDWERNANFTGTYDDIWDDVIAVNWSLGMDKPYQHMAGEGICQITVRNVDGKYNPDNSSSPLAGYLVPFRPVKLTATVGETEITLWRGWLDDISSEWSPAASQSGNITAVLRCVGAKQLMQESELNLPLQQNKRGDEIAALVLDQVVLPPAVIGGWLLQQNGYSEIGQTTFLASADDYSELEEGVMRFQYYGDIRAIDKEDDDEPLSDRSREQDAYRVLRDVTEGERGRFFFNREGKAIWWNRDHLVDLISDSSVIDTSGVLGIRPSAMDVSHGSSLANRVQVTAYQREEGSTLTLWSLTQPMSLDAGEVRTFSAPFTDENDLQAGALENISVANLVVAGDVDIQLDTQADRAQVTITANQDSTVTSFDIQGDVLSSTNRFVVLQEDSDSIRDYGRRRLLKLNLRTINNYDDAQDIAAWELRYRKDPRTEVASASFINKANGTDNAQQLAWQIGDRIRVKTDEIGHDADYYIIGEQHAVYGGGAVHESTLILEPVAFTRLAHYGKQFADEWVSLKDGTNDRLGQQFQVSEDHSIDSVRLWLHRTGSPDANLNVKIFADDLLSSGWELGSSELEVQTFLNSDGPFPDNLLGTSETIASSTLNPLGWMEFSFSTPVNISANTTYWLVLEASDPDLISYWPLDEASGTRYDAHGSNHLTDNNTVTQAIGLQGSAAQFTRANGEFLNITHAAQNGLDITGPFTFATSFSLDSLPGPTGFHFVLGGKFGGGGNRGWVVYVYWATNTLRFITSHDGTTLTVQDHPTVLTTGVRYFACARYDGSQMHLRLNATDASALNQAGGIFNNSANFQIGTYGSAALLCHNGSIDEAGFWQRALTNAEVTYLYNLGRRRNYQASRVFPDAANDIQWGADGSAPAYANGDMRYQISGGEWLADGLDACFEVYAA